MSPLHLKKSSSESRTKLILVSDDHVVEFRKKTKELSWKKSIFVIVAVSTFLYATSMLFLIFLRDDDICSGFKVGDSYCASLFGFRDKKFEGRINEPKECGLAKDSRYDCHPEDGATRTSCVERGCCWNPIKRNKHEETKRTGVPLDTPYCYYPKNWTLYKLINSTFSKTHTTEFYENIADSAYKKDIKLVRFDSIFLSPTIARVKIVDAREKRYEPHLPIISNTTDFGKNIEHYKYSVEVAEKSPGFRIRRNSDDSVLFDFVKGFVFADQFLQIILELPRSNIYGLGEHRTNMKLNTNWQSYTMFNKDGAPTENANLYGSQPFFISIEQSGSFTGFLFLNSNAMDFILQPKPAITIRSIGGVFDIYVFFGPEPSNVVQQYSEIVGKPFMPPYWSLGFHLCRYGYGSLEKTKEVWKRTQAAGIPFDTQWNDLDYMSENNDFTYNKKKFKDLPNFVNEIHKAGMHYIPLIDPGISASEVNGSYRPYDEGIRRNVFIKEAKSDLPFKGKVWNRKSTVWPDFTNPNTTEYWYKMMNDMWQMFPYDGAWIDMNEPSNFYDGHADGCEKNNLDNPPYVPNVAGNLLASKTLCMNARLHLGSHYNLHNIYGMTEAIATNEALKKIRGLRPFVISRATWVGQGKYSGHWSGDVYSTWHDMRMTIPQLLSFGLFQIPMMGADICGFNGNTTQSLCNRWMQLGAFYPFSRNHNSDDTIEQDPVAMGELVVKSSRKALMIRYRFLPYLYTLFFRAHMFGETVARPLFFEFADDKVTHDIDTQFLWGSSFMIVPVLEENAITVTAYLPRDTWYDFYDKKLIKSDGRNYTLDAPLDTIPLLVRGGSILPAQTPGKTTTESRKNPFELLIAPDILGKASGELYWDDGDSIDSIDKSNYRWLRFNLEDQTLTNEEIKPGKYSEKMILGKVQIMGISKDVKEVLINGNKFTFKYDKLRSYLTVKGLEVDLRENFKLSWK